MASSYEIQVAIAAVIQAAAPSAIVVPRNILGQLQQGQWGMIQDGSNKIHGWVVTMIANPITNEINLEYDPRFWVWQILQYDTGNDTVNSEKTFLDENDAVRNAFSPPLGDPLQNANPPSFDDMRTSPEGMGGALVHIARGFITVKGLSLFCPT